VKRIVVIIVILLFVKDLLGQKISLAEAKKDFSVFKTALVEAHPGLCGLYIKI